MNKVLLLLLLSASLISCNKCLDNKKVQKVEYKIGILGVPSLPEVEWNDRNMQLMKKMGFNAMQLNIAWGYRPADNPLNLEDVLVLPKKFELPVDIDSTLNTNVGSSKTFIRNPDRIAARAKELKHRIALCKKYGMRSIFHFGAPFVAYPAVEPLSQCISDPLTLERYVTLIGNFNKEFPGVDDLLLYTYDQNAWLCSEDGACERCYGVPLDKRVSAFVNTLAQTWNSLNRDGKLWWEPWEISAGQTYSIIEQLDSKCLGLSMHSGITEVQIALPADRWFKNMLTLAEERNIPVIGELWMGTATEEVETYLYLPTPLATLRALRAVNNAGKLKGIKEYYGNIPDREDPNLRMTSIFFNNPDVSDNKAMQLLSKPYKIASEKIAMYWKFSSEAIEMYPWDISWNSREVGRSDPHHLMTAATLKGVSWETPSWQSNRRAAFMRTVETETPHFWMLEDAQLRYEATAKKIDKALEYAREARENVPKEFLTEFDMSVKELKGFRQRVLAYAYHIRETNLCKIMRQSLGKTGKVNEANLSELRTILLNDQQNQGTENYIAQAIELLDKDLKKFLNVYFNKPKPSGVKADMYFNESLPPEVKTVWTVTSQ
ncbi:MAG: hypothetical protein M0Q26_13580 [Chitinophagaceae bacterium]|nr:hypothetical protein [Chitinophagaceae bacterium]